MAHSHSDRLDRDNWTFYPIVGTSGSLPCPYPSHVVCVEEMQKTRSHVFVRDRPCCDNLSPYALFVIELLHPILHTKPI